ncbi:MAG TPA: hypothetical protein VHL58_01890 [Thermoanaerobaculia bacterium]|nr:hypothetical protein [Thermoanaerobaculia bacterium]
MKRIMVSILVCLAALSLQAQVSDGDGHWAMRAEGHQGARGMAIQIDAAMNAYRNAVKQDPNDLEARWKLLRAMRFKGSYVVSGTDAKKPVFAEAKKLGEESMVIVNRLLAAKGVKSVDKASEKQVADVARAIPNAGEVIYWDAVADGEWAIIFGKMAAVRAGMADRIKRESTIVMMIDPKIENGGGARVLGRLHNQTPHVPFITGWASDLMAVKYLKQSLAQDPTNKLTKVFLAEAMKASNSDTKPQAVQMLKEVINSPNDPNYLVEQLTATEDAKALLKQWGA